MPKFHVAMFAAALALMALCSAKLHSEGSACRSQDSDHTSLLSVKQPLLTLMGSATTQMEATTRKEATPTYELGSKGSNACPSGYSKITIRSDCIAAAVEGVGSIELSVGNDGVTAEASTTWPSGCYIWHISQHTNAVYYNSNPNGAPQSMASPICKKASTTAEPTPTPHPTPAGDSCTDDSSGCPHWQTQGYCDTGTANAFVTKHCRLSCGLCKAEPPGYMKFSGCLIAEDTTVYRGKTVAECAAFCDALTSCFVFKFDVADTGSNHYAGYYVAGNCTLTRSGLDSLTRTSLTRTIAPCSTLAGYVPGNSDVLYLKSRTTPAPTTAPTPAPTPAPTSAPPPALTPAPTPDPTPFTTPALPSTHGCYFIMPTTGNSKCDGPFLEWTKDQWGKYNKGSWRSEAACLSRKSAKDNHCGTATIWTFVPEASCAGFTGCTDGDTLRAQPNRITCGESGCTSRQCCLSQATQTCADFTGCPKTGYAKRAQPAGISCLESGCTVQQCCRDQLP